MELLRKVFAFGKWALIGGGLYQVLQPEVLPASLVLLSEIVLVIGIPCFFIPGAWLLCLNWAKLRKRGFGQSVKDEWSEVKCRTGTKTVLVVGSMAFLCVYLIPAYISKSIIGMTSAEAPWWVQAFAGVGAFGIVICIIAFFASRNKKDKD